MEANLMPVLQLFLGFLGIGLSVMFCTTFCRACQRYREEQLERERVESELVRRGGRGGGGRPPPIYFIPFPRQRSHQDEEDPPSSPRGQDIYGPPRYSTAAPAGPPPAYNELELKPEDLPPAYTEYPVPPPPPLPPHMDVRSMSQP